MYEQYLYKQQLLNTMAKDQSLVDNVKLHLRQKIINKLKSNKPLKQIEPDKLLIKKLSASLFLDYLQQNQLFHTASVFSPESGFSKSQFSQEQLKSLFRIDTEKCDSILEAVIKQVMPKGRLTEKRIDISVQTDDRQNIQNLQNMLSQIDFSYKQKMSMGLKTVEDTEQRFLKWKNDLKKQYKGELDAEIERIRNYQISNIRMEERQKYQLKVKQYQEQLDQSYRNKLDKLRQREEEVIKRVTNKMKDVEKYNHEMRQKILKDMEAIQQREQEIQKAKRILQEKQMVLIRNKMS